MFTLRNHVELRLHIAEVRSHAEIRAANRHQRVVRLFWEQPQTLGVVRPVLIQVLQTTCNLPPLVEQVSISILLLAHVEEVILQLHITL